MNVFLTALCVFCGGGTGALCRYALSGAVSGLFGAPGYVGILVVNLLGCFAIGVTFVCLEVAFRRDGKSRLKGTPLGEALKHRRGLTEHDPTLQAVDYFWDDQRLRFTTSFMITGFLGGFTTFSSFALDTFELAAEARVAAVVVNLVASVVGGICATWLGMDMGRRVFAARGDSPKER